MRKYLMVSGIIVGAVVVVGLLMAVWFRFGREEELAVNSAGGSIPLDAGSTSTPTPDPLGLQVREVAPGSVQGAAQVGGTNATPAPAATEPTDFKEYEKYRDEENALYGEIVAGQGQEVVAGSKLTVAYRGWLIDGKLFDEGRGFSFVMGEGRVIAGWEQGLMGMKVGGKRRLIVPPAAGYGAEANGPIPANSLLVFDVELLDVK